MPAEVPKLPELTADEIFTPTKHDRLAQLYKLADLPMPDVEIDPADAGMYRQALCAALDIIRHQTSIIENLQHTNRRFRTRLKRQQ